MLINLLNVIYTFILFKSNHCLIFKVRFHEITQPAFSAHGGILGL